MEENAKKWANYYNIYAKNSDGSINYNPDARGNGDARDAFRHAYTTLETKRYLMETFGISNQLASKIAYGALGTGVELFNSNNFKPNDPSINYLYNADLKMDLWNDAKGSPLTSSSEAESARKAKELLGKGDLITDNTKQDPRNLADLKVPGSGENYADNWGNIMLKIYRDNYDLWKEIGKMFAGGIVDLAQYIADLVGNIAAGIGNFANSLLSPIALDLNGNGKIDTIYHNASTNKAYFDMDNDGFREKVQWLTPNADGWLARNININSTNDNFVLDVQKIAS